jgi:hypothetical protein
MAASWHVGRGHGKIIPKAEHDMPKILTAAELLTKAAEQGGSVEFARIAVLQAINRHVGQVFNPSRKDPHWGRRTHSQICRDDA